MAMTEHPNYLRTPSVGRIVHYVSRGSADGFFKPQCRAAIITVVRLVALAGRSLIHRSMTAR